MKQTSHHRRLSIEPDAWPHGCGSSCGRRRDRHGECGAQHNDATGLHSTTSQACSCPTWDACLGAVARAAANAMLWLQFVRACQVEPGNRRANNALYARAKGLFSWFAVCRSPPMPCHTYASASDRMSSFCHSRADPHSSIGLFVLVHHHPLFRCVSSRASLRRVACLMPRPPPSMRLVVHFRMLSGRFEAFGSQLGVAKR